MGVFDELIADTYVNHHMPVPHIAGTKEGFRELVTATRRAFPDVRVHVEDLISCILKSIDHPKARQQTFNVCMTDPVDYGQLGAYLTETRNMPQVPIKTPYQSTWLDNAKARFLLDWHPEYDLKKLTDAAFDYKRSKEDPRIVWYPG